jgi:hypothetical protein
MAYRYLGFPVDCSIKKETVDTVLQSENNTYTLLKSKEELSSADMVTMEHKYLGMPIKCQAKEENIDNSTESEMFNRYPSFSSEEWLSTEDIQFMESIFNDIIQEDPFIEGFLDKSTLEELTINEPVVQPVRKAKRRTRYNPFVRITRSYNTRVLRNRSYRIPLTVF